MGAIRIGLVGTGHWARTVHGPGVLAHDGVELAGVWGRDTARTAGVAAEFGIPAYDDVDDLMERVDALTFAVPPDVQAPLALRAAAAGKHLLLEKPIATDLAAATELAEAAAGVTSLVFFTDRFIPQWEDWLMGMPDHRPRSGRVDWLAYLDPDGPNGDSLWRQQRGALWDLGPHALASLLPVLGPVRDVSGRAGEGDFVDLDLTHADGSTSRMSLSLTAADGARDEAVEFGDGHRTWARPEVPGRPAGAAYAQAVSEFADCIRAGVTQHRCDVRLGRDVVEVLARCEAVLAGERSR
ncbi:Gfo/Idh/MocA family protein [Nocardioides limicola]|uniref:Gfo/Idh/MocA family protein n=1 Tax=Nocardioides limicola TaxID=2803368 RepID=UPI00193B2231|nr:Gfo/Idh/MocA family oxidoreductase [Nocardioides sp. DJM-14]